MNPPARLACLGLVVVLTTLGLEAMPSFVPIDFPGAAITVALGINRGGEIVGTYESAGVRHGYRLSGGVFTSIDYPGALQSSAHGIGSSGNIVGAYLDSTGVVHAFLRGSGGTFTSIDFPGALHTLATAINPAGKIVGAYTGSAIPAHAFHGFLLDNGQFTKIDFPGAILTIATGIGLEGEIVGAYRALVGGKVHGFSLHEGVYSTIDVPGAIDTFALGINPSGDIVGQYKVADGWHGFVMTEDAFNTIDFPGGTLGPGPSFWPFKENAAYGINASGSIVGQYRGGDGSLHGYRLRLDCPEDELLSSCMAHEEVEYSLAQFGSVATPLHQDGVVNANVDVLGYYFAQALGRPAPTPESYGIPAAGQSGRDSEYNLDQWWSMLRAHRLVGLHAPANALR
jgi:hypothetical protein